MVHAAAGFLSLSCKLAGLQEQARGQAICLAQFVRGMGQRKLGWMEPVATVAIWWVFT